MFQEELHSGSEEGGFDDQRQKERFRGCWIGASELSSNQVYRSIIGLENDPAENTYKKSSQR